MIHPYAGFWKRFWAFLVDGIIVAIPPAIVCLPIFFWQGYSMFNDSQDALPKHLMIMVAAYILWQVLGLITYWLYFAFMESGERQATFGKRLLKIKVVGRDGGRISFWRATGRTFAKILSYMIVYIGYFMAGLTNRKRALHDYIVDTYVVEASFQPGDEMPETVFHKGWLIALSILMCSAFASIVVVGALADRPAMKAQQVSSQLQLLKEGILKVEDMPRTLATFAYDEEDQGYYAEFESHGNGYTLFLPEKGDGQVFCVPELTEGDCEATGLEEFTWDDED